MINKHKAIPRSQASAHGAHLHARRTQKGITLASIGCELEIDVGQLSRFERGEFKRLSRNLRKYSKYLQISERELDNLSDSFPIRIAAIAAKSDAHRAAVEDILLALERLA